MKRSLKIVLGVVVVLLIIVALIPLFINANTFRPKIESDLSAALGRKVTIGNMKFSIFTGSLQAENVAIADDPTFSTAPFLQTPNLKIGVEMQPLIFDHQVHVTSFTATQPAVHLVHAANGTWNFSSFGTANAASTGTPNAASTGTANAARTAKPASSTPQQASSMPQLTVQSFQVQDGTVTVTSVPAESKPVVYTQVNLSAKNFSFASRFPFTLSANLPASGQLKLDGEAGPIAKGDASLTPFSATLDLKHLDPVAAGLVDASQGLAMVADANAKLGSDSQNVTAVGTARANGLKIARQGTPAQQPLDLAYNLVYNLQSRVATIQSLQPRIGNVAINTKGTVELAGREPVLKLQTAGGGLPIDQLEALLPAFGVKLPSGSKLQGGTLGFNFAITGTPNATVITGPLTVDNTRMAGFNLGAKIQGLNGASTGNSTLIRSLLTTLTAAPSGIRTDNLVIVIPGLGTGTGAGTISPASILNYQLLLKLDSGVGVLGMVNSLAGQRLSAATANGIPLTITGPASNPSFHADVSNLLKNNAGGLINGFLNRKGNTPGKKPNPSDLINGILGKH
ncbi:MAG: AsmA family protein [Acidobacteriaceae bacterium]